MNTSLLLTAVAAAALVLPATAASSASTPASARQYAKCAADKYEGAELLATQPGSAEETEVLAEFVRRSCNPPTNDQAVLRGTVAEELFRMDFGSSIGSQVRRDMVEVFTVGASELEELDAAARTRIDFVAFGTCVAATDSPNTAALLKTESGSAAEARVVAELQPKFSPCLEEGEQLNLSKAQLRGALAEGAYRLALAETLDEEVIVTGARDPSKTVQCKKQDISGTRFRRTICMTGAQWDERARNAEIAATDLKRQADDYNNAKTVCLTRFREGCLIR